MTTITFTGDMMLGRTFDKNPIYPWSQGVLEILNNTLLCTNLETTITTATEKYPDKTFNFKVAPSNFEKLLPTSNTPMVVNLANNHILDYKEIGLIETVETLDKLGIAHTGAGRSLEEAEQPVIVKYNGLSVGMLGFADHYVEWAATKNKPGINFVDIKSFGWERALKLVERIAKKVNVMIVYLHYGSNWAEQPLDAFVQFNRALIDHGTTIVAGTSPHHLQHIESYKNGIIFYSLGGIIDDYAIDKYYRNDLTILAQVIFDNKGKIARAQAYPAKIESQRLRLLKSKEDDYGWVAKRIQVKKLLN